MEKDWIAHLDAELAKVRKRFKGSITPEDRDDIIRHLSEIFFNIWIRFAVDLGHEMALTPWQWDVALYEGQKHWHLKQDFNYAQVGEVVLEDEYFGHPESLRAELFTSRKRPRVRVVFRLNEEVQGDERLQTDYLVYSATFRQLDFHGLWKALEPLVKAWYEAHVRRDQEMLWDHVKERYSIDRGA